MSTLHPTDLTPQLSHGALTSPRCRWPLGPHSSLSFQPQQLWSLNPKPLCAAGVSLISAGRTCGGHEGCPRRSLGDLPWGSEGGRARFYLGSGNGNGTKGRVPAWVQVDPGLQAGAWLRGLCLKVSLPQPHCFHGNQSPLAGVQLHPHSTPTLPSRRGCALVIGEHVGRCDSHSLAWVDVTRL